MGLVEGKAGAVCALRGAIQQHHTHKAQIGAIRYNSSPNDRCILQFALSFPICLAIRGGECHFVENRTPTDPPQLFRVGDVSLTNPRTRPRDSSIPAQKPMKVSAPESGDASLGE